VLVTLGLERKGNMDKLIIVATVILSILMVAPCAYPDTVILNGRNVTGTSKKDALGYTHSDFYGGKYHTKCVSKKDALGYTHTECHSD